MRLSGGGWSRMHMPPPWPGWFSRRPGPNRRPKWGRAPAIENAPCLVSDTRPGWGEVVTLGLRKGGLSLLM